MLCEGAVKELVVHCAVAVPPPPGVKATLVQVPIATLSDLKVTVPVGLNGEGGVGDCEPLIATVAVKVMESPWFAGLLFEASIGVELNKSTGVFTVLVLSGLPANTPVTVPKFETCGVPGGTPVRFGGLLTVTWKLIVTESPL